MSKELTIIRVANGWVLHPEQDPDTPPFLERPAPVVQVAMSIDNLVALVIAWAKASRGDKPQASDQPGPVVGDVE